MAQQPVSDYPIDPVVTSGTQLADILNRTNQVLNSGNSGTSRPPMITQGGLWVKTGGAEQELYMFDGTTDIAIASSSQLGNFVQKSGDTMTGPLVVPNATAGNQALNQDSGDARYLSQATGDSRYVNIAGDTMTGGLVVNSDIAYTGTLSGNTGVVNIGGGQIYKDSKGYVGMGTTNPLAHLHINALELPILALTDQKIGENYGGALRGFGQLGLGGYCELGVIDAGSYTAAIQVQQQSAQIIFFGRGGTAESGRFNASGRFLVNTSDVIGNDGSMLSVKNGISTGVDNTVLSPAVSFHNPNGRVGYIATDGVTTSYVTSSDYRLKENVLPMQGALAKIAALNPVTFTWKGGGKAGQGFIAHELQAVLPDCVTGEKDGMRTVDEFDSIGAKSGTTVVPDYQGVDTSFLVATLVAAIQELSAKVAALEAK